MKVMKLQNDFGYEGNIYIKDNANRKSNGQNKYLNEIMQTIKK
jgi:hypothetical protein